VYGLVGYEPLTYEEYVYPVWANVLGWIIAGSSIIMIPGTAVYKLLTTPGTFIQVCYRALLEKLIVAHLLTRGPPLDSILNQLKPVHTVKFLNNL
jgi:hypothetical protein